MSNAAASAASMKDKASQFMPGVSLFLSVTMFVTSFILFSTYSGDSDRWVHIQSQVQKVLILTLIGTALFTFAALMYFTQDPTHSIYFVIIMSCLSLGLSYAALAIGAISK